MKVISLERDDSVGRINPLKIILLDRINSTKLLLRH